MTLPGSRALLLGYDASGNLTSVTPPDKPAHGLGYTPVDELGSYSPPGVGGTLYHYTPDRLLDLVELPSGRVVGEHQAAGTFLLAVSVGMAVAAWVIEPATTEAAFPEIASRRG